MISFGHIVNPVAAGKNPGLDIAQPITLETMRLARDFAKGVEIHLYAAPGPNEERTALPDMFEDAGSLKRSICDIKQFKLKRNLPLIKDILDLLYAATPADYLVYTNIDIALQPYFYLSLAQIIGKGYDCFVVNRRTVSADYRRIEQIPEMYAQTGSSHPGYDCFVFKKVLYPKFILGNICIGTAWIGRALLANMVCFSQKFREFNNLHLTFHIGDDVDWRKAEYDDYLQENHREYLTIFTRLESENKRFEPALRSYLLDTGAQRQFPSFE